MPYSLQLPESETQFWTLHLDLIAASRKLLTAAAKSKVGEQARYAASLLKLDEQASLQFTLYAAANGVRTSAVE
jgi:hypothetical protein